MWQMGVYLNGVGGPKCQVSSGTTVPEASKNMIFKAAITLWWGLLGDEEIWAKPVEYNRNIDAEKARDGYKENQV